MVIHKRWEKYAKSGAVVGGTRRVFMEGWFLFGFLPLFIREDPRFD